MSICFGSLIMEIYILTALVIISAPYAAGDRYPLLNNGDVHLYNVTDSSVLLTWNATGWTRANLDLKLAFQFIPEDSQMRWTYWTWTAKNDQICSIKSQQCLFSYLTHDTNYLVSIWISAGNNTAGRADLKFNTLPRHYDGVLNCMLSWACFFALVLVNITIVCVKLCHYFCWRKKDKVSMIESTQRSITVRSLRLTSETGDYESLCSTPSSRTGTDSYLSVVSGLSVTPQPPGFHRGVGTGSNLLSSQQAHIISLEAIRTGRHQNNHQNHTPQQSNHQACQSSLPQSPEVGSDGYLRAKSVHKPKLALHYADSSLPQIFKKL